MKVAVIQHPPEYLNLPKSIKLGVELIQTAAEKGAKLIVFPEAWFPGYPEYVWRLKPGGEMSLTDDLFKISQANSVNLSKGHMKPIQDAAKKNKVVVVTGLDNSVQSKWDESLRNKNRWVQRQIKAQSTIPESPKNSQLCLHGPLDT